MGEEFKYLEALEDIFQELHQAQLELISAQKGLQAVIELFKEFSQSPIGDMPNQDPVFLEVRRILDELSDTLNRCLMRMDELKPPENWKRFHDVFKRSLELQREGYEEMKLVFVDKNIKHIYNGNKLVEMGLKLLEAGRKGRDDEG